MVTQSEVLNGVCRKIDSVLEYLWEQEYNSFIECILNEDPETFGITNEEAKTLIELTNNTTDYSSGASKFLRKLARKATGHIFHDMVLLNDWLYPDGEDCETDQRWY